MAKLIDLTGQRFGRLVVIERAENAKNGKAKWLCLCDCGNNTIVLGTHLNSGHTQSCGCIHSEVVCAVMNKHGACNSRLYRIWAGMIKRTYNQQSKDFGYYGGRGITVCDSWKNDFQPFHDWAIESGYSDNLTLDRIDNQKGYSPDNCRWVTMKIQCNNKSNNRFIEFRGERKTLSQWADLLGIKGCTLLWRLRKGWSIEKALSTPPQKQEQIVSIKK